MAKGQSLWYRGIRFEVQGSGYKVANEVLLLPCTLYLTPYTWPLLLKPHT